MTFAETIKRTRQRLFFSQEAFAKELSVNLTTVSRWETGRSKPNISTMRQIKEFCEMHNVDYEPIESSWLTFEQENKWSRRIVMPNRIPARASIIL